MDNVDIFAVNALTNSNNPYLTRIGKILYRCNGTLDVDQTDEIANLLKDYMKYVHEDYEKGYDKGWEDAREEFECDCYD